jgi:hypothetical protein
VASIWSCTAPSLAQPVAMGYSFRIPAYCDAKDNAVEARTCDEGRRHA